MSDQDSLTHNVYCDESCHLEGDSEPFMVLGAVWHSSGKTKAIAERLRELKLEHGLGRHTELKWVNVSNSKLPYYRAVLDYFFDSPDLHFRGLIAAKAGLDHDRFHQDHDTWYYKMYFQLLRWFLEPPKGYKIYLDQKDTRGAEKIDTLRRILCTRQVDFIGHMSTVRSHQVEQIQLADFLSGILSYSIRGFKTSEAKLELVRVFELKTKHPIRLTSPLDSRKVNIFHWRPRGG